MFKTGLIFTLGGIIGNLIDRLHLKYVIDMIQLDFVQFNILTWPILPLPWALY